MYPLTLFLFLFLSSPSPTLSDPLSKLCEGDNYASNSTFESNLNNLLTSISLLSTNSSFNKTSNGSTPYIVYGLFLCRGVVGPTICHDCVQTAIQDAPAVCPYNKQATVWYYYCELRYSDTSITGYGNSEIAYYPSDGSNTTVDPGSLSGFTKELMKNISYAAAYNSSELMFATGMLVLHLAGQQEVRIYGMAECTRDLSMVPCNICLGEIIDDSWPWPCCGALDNGGVLGKSCNFRYDVSKFFNGTPTVSITRSIASSPPPAPSQLVPLQPAATVPTDLDHRSGNFL